MNLPEIIYKSVDKLILPILGIFVPKDAISRCLEKESEFFGEGKIKYLIALIGTVNERASTMVGHLSIMLALCIFYLQTHKTYNASLIVVSIDVFVYIILVILTVRCLRSIGLDKDYNDLASYIEHAENELVTKYSIMQFVNSVTILATVFLVISFIFSI
ncbi:hypothetical protein FGF66_07135 [Chlorobaculum thiosulfatiphilum]|jgi:hypothetical protein|uniref:Uncharacterized protein n=1 Tax=Chlorobaculum thiosulfatiphilum TaxID=115852 RepID=A0A5C4S6N1_CHLTI|nr:hypothetical protein [Chlorobaculum thiosulfatiphilum]TNJ38892.1 hypothetical protein FGF66_07135 [Chlorobaculum thiosulfatiphilum]